ncbi:hypothetical protein C8J56DRAFT_774912 [Mycena floridula]|nr:hypothetical protein C8J56DRAFT_774912 [Mycena floridula]
MGNSPSNLPPPSLPGSPLQLCLNNVFHSNSLAVSYPQDILYQVKAVKAYNTNINIIPAAVTRPTTAEEVAQVVRCAVESRVKVQARGGGHSYANYCLGGTDGAVVVDLVNFQQFDMDSDTWRARIGAGTRLGDVTKKLHDAGNRLIAHGTCPEVGIGGHATIGGLGPLSRLYGTALDHVQEVQVVLANSTIVRASSTLNTDVFWAMKGAGASFGIVTEFVVATHPEPTNTIHYSFSISLGHHSAMAATFSTWQSIISDPALTRKLASQLIVFQLGMIISGTFFGTSEEYKALGFEKRLGQNATQVTVIELTDWLGTAANWAENEALKLVGGLSAPFYAKSLIITPDNMLSEKTANGLFQYFDSADKGTLLWFAIFDLAGGAVNDVAQSATAYAHRNALFYFQSYAVGIGSVSTKTRNFLTKINQIITSGNPGKDFGTYAGYVDPELPNAQQEYWGSNLPRLQHIKAAIDPHDVFHNPQSVSPAK